MLHGGRAVPPFGPWAGDGLAAAHGAPPHYLGESSSLMAYLLNTASEDPAPVLLMGGLQTFTAFRAVEDPAPVFLSAEVEVGSTRLAAEDPAPVLIPAGWSRRGAGRSWRGGVARVVGRCSATQLRTLLLSSFSASVPARGRFREPCSCPPSRRLPGMLVEPRC
eukprot:6111276-Pyramimonas_sp.AAC.1